MPEIKILYDNISIQKGVKHAWGFSCLVKYNGRNILFDTGGKADILLSNMKALRISPKTVTDVFISHNHWDHAGGLFSFLDKNHNVRVYLPTSFSETYKKEVEASEAKCVRIKTFTRIAKDIYSSGTMGKDIKEQFLIIDTPKGLILITGCSHPGIVTMAKWAKKGLKKEVSMIIGGFHLGENTNKEVSVIVAKLKSLGVRKIAPCHCTGKKAIRLFEKNFINDFITIGAGSVMN